MDENRLKQLIERYRTLVLDDEPNVVEGEILQLTVDGFGKIGYPAGTLFRVVVEFKTTLFGYDFNSFLFYLQAIDLNGNPIDNHRTATFHWGEYLNNRTFVRVSEPGYYNQTKRIIKGCYGYHKVGFRDKLK